MTHVVCPSSVCSGTKERNTKRQCVGRQGLLSLSGNHCQLSVFFLFFHFVSCLLFKCKSFHPSHVIDKEIGTPVHLLSLFLSFVPSTLLSSRKGTGIERESNMWHNEKHSWPCFLISFQSPTRTTRLSMMIDFMSFRTHHGPHKRVERCSECH